MTFWELLGVLYFLKPKVQTHYILDRVLYNTVYVTTKLSGSFRFTENSPVDLMDIVGSSRHTCRPVGQVMMKDRGPGQAGVHRHGDVEDMTGWVCWRGLQPGRTAT